MPTDESAHKTLENKNYVQAVNAGKERGANPDDILTWQRGALWEMGAVNRNAFAVKILATQYGFSKEQVREIVERAPENEAEERALKPRYDYVTNQHLDFSKWVDQLFSKWNKIPDK